MEIVGRLQLDSRRYKYNNVVTRSSFPGDLKWT